MHKAQIIKILKENEAAIRAAGATALFLFGSSARGEERSDSDVDLFIDHDVAGNFSVIELARLRRMIAECLRADADLTTRAGLHPLARDRVIAEAERVF